MGLGGLEPPTSSLSVKRSNHLSYRPVRALVTLQDEPRIKQIDFACPHFTEKAWLLVVGETNSNATNESSHNIEDQRQNARKQSSGNNVECAESNRE